MEAWLLLWKEVSQKEIFHEVLLHLGQSLFWTCIHLERLLGMQLLCRYVCLDVLINDNYECWEHAGIPSFGLLVCYVTR
jgi:hypothetical protein